MTSFAIIGDSHFDERSRFEECIRLHDWIASEMERLGVSLVLHSGDVFERKSSPAERLAFGKWLQRVTRFAEVVIVRGNHDSPQDLRLFEAFGCEEHNVTVYEEPGVHLSQSGLRIACLPWPNLAALTAAATSGQEAQEVASDAIRAILRGLGQFTQHGGHDSVLLAHCLVRGSVTSHGQPLIGHALELGLDDLALCPASLYALGHIHMRQQWDLAGSPVVYPGAPRRTAFGELEAKGFYFGQLDIELDTLAFYPAPATAMLLLDCTWGDSGFSSWEPIVPSGAEVRFRYHVGSDCREAARAAAESVKDELLELGASLVKLEEVVDVATRARAPEVASSVTVAEKLRAHWAASNSAPSRPEEVIRKLSQLEDASHAN